MSFRIKFKTIRKTVKIKRITIILAPCLNLNFRCRITKIKVRIKGMVAGNKRRLP